MTDTKVKTVFVGKTINLGIFSEELRNVEQKAENKEIFDALTEAGLNPKDYRADQHDYTPFLLHIAIEGELQNFLSIIKDHYDLVASVFKVLTEDYLLDLVNKHKTSYGVQKAKLETKMIAVGYIARSTTAEQQNGMLEAYEKYAAERENAIAGQKAIQAKLTAVA